MFVTAKEAAKQFDITVERLEKISLSKTAPKKLVNDDGKYDTDVLAQVMERIRKRNEDAKKYHQQRKKQGIAKARKGRKVSKSVKRRLAHTTPTETLDEFTKRFWITDDRWFDFVTCEVNGEWMRHFVQSALEFGYRTAYTE